MAEDLDAVDTIVSTDYVDGAECSKHYSFDQDGVPLMLNWSIKDVGEWVRIDLGFPDYEDCFVSNFISGRKLILIDASSLQKLGVQDFEHIKVNMFT